MYVGYGSTATSSSVLDAACDPPFRSKSHVQCPEERSDGMRVQPPHVPFMSPHQLASRKMEGWVSCRVGDRSNRSGRAGRRAGGRVERLEKVVSLWEGG